MASSKRPSPEPLLRKRGGPSRTAANSGNALEASKAVHHRALALWGSQSYSRREFQEKLSECFRGLSEIFLELLPESPSRAGGMATNRSEELLGPESKRGEVLVTNFKLILLGVD